jgi:hypothetical protein
MHPSREAGNDKHLERDSTPVEAKSQWHHLLPGSSKHDLTRPAQVQVAESLAALALAAQAARKAQS